MADSSTQTAVFVRKIGAALEIGTREIPTPKAHHILIRVQSTMLLPHDTYGRDSGLFFGENLPFILGTNIAGTVISTGSSSVATRFSPGDDVFGIDNPLLSVPDETGLQQYALLDAESSAKIPTGFSFDDMATFPVNAMTSFAALFHEKGFSFPVPSPSSESDRIEWDPKKETILVIGGGSNVGKMALQFGKLVGLGKILTIASATNTSTLKALGATHAIDRHLNPSDIQAKIHEIVGTDGLTKIYDCVSWDFTFPLSLLSPTEPGLLLTLHPAEEADKIISEGKLNAEARMILGGPSFLQPLTSEFWNSLPGWVVSGHLVVGKYKVVDGFNLMAIEEGLDSYRDGNPVTPIVVHP